ncbi:MAG TPA: dienelactone hydrolase family protein [Acidimicrobiia bacterium]
MPDDLLAGFTESSFTHDDLAHPLFTAGAGPAVIVIHEAPGLHPGVVAFGRRLVDAGFTVVMPSLFGTPGREVSVGYTARVMARICVAREFGAFALDRTSPAMHWLRALAARAHTEHGGPGVGALGMCFTGGFALGMTVGDDVLAPVLSQPSLPLGPGRRRKTAVGISDDDFTRVKQRCATEGVDVLGLRFSEDPFVPGARFDTLERELGERFVRVDIDSRPGNPHGIGKRAHSVLTRDLVDEPGHPTRAALDQVVAFFRERLLPGT